jgi:hypothetical protein
LKVGAAAFEGFFFVGIRPSGAEQGVHGQQDDAQQPEDEENEEKLYHRTLDEKD